MMKERFWNFVHNCVAHPLEGVVYLVLGRVPNWVDDFYDWSVPNDLRRKFIVEKFRRVDFQ
jgi:hypothetical protein